MSITDAARFRHMLDAAKKARQFAEGRARADLERDEMFALALVRLLEVLGEAASAVSEEERRKTPQLPWKELAGTRNRLVHGYFDVDLDIVWNIVTRDVPPLIAALERLVVQEDL